MRATPRAPGLFFGFSKGADGRWLALPARPSRQIEFIADSGSTGYGNLSATVDCPDEEVAARSDASQSYPIVASHQLHADWQLNAMDGIGLVRNWHGIWKGTSYTTYAGLTLQSDAASRYEPVEWHPQVAVVRIGGNDFGSALGADEPWTAAQLEAEFTAAYRSLLTGLRARLGPNGLIIVIQPGPDDNPANRKVADIVDSLRSAGDLRLYELQFPTLQLTGCDSHPNLSDHRLMSATLVKFIEDHGGRELHWTTSSDNSQRHGRQGTAMQSIPVGATGSFSLLVLPEHLAGRFKDVTLPPVLATPVMIMVMENAALNAIKPFLDAGESALGTHVDVRHLAATPAGQRITGEATVTGVDGRRIEFSIRATHGNDEIGVGTHERVVVQLSKLAERMKAKFG